MFLRNPPFLALLLLLPLVVLLWRWRGMRLVAAALFLRLAAVTALVIALAEPNLGQEQPSSGPIVILVDQSDSLTEAGRATLRAEAEQFAALHERSTLIWFGRYATVVDRQEQPAEDDADNAQVSRRLTALDPSASDLGGALRVAYEVLAQSGGRVALFSDGVQTGDNALPEARRLAAAGIMVDVRPTTVEPTAELSISRMVLPRTLRVGEEYPVAITVAYEPGSSGGATSGATLRLFDGDTLLAEERVTLDAGANEFTLRHQAATPGIVRLRAEVAGSPDTFVRNNQAGATALVAEPPRILLVEGRPGESNDFSAALRRAGIESDTIDAPRMPARLSELDRYDGIVLLDVPAGALTIDQMASVREFVRSEGRGLVAIGGRNSYGLGAYKNTPLEQVLPVNMDPPPRPQRSDIALLLIIDRSASMTAISGASKFDMAKEAAILATETLQPEDSIGILAFDTGQLWVVPFQRISEGLGLEQIQDAIARLPSGGGTDIYGALNEGLPAIISEQVSTRHVVLLTDGRSFTNDLGAYQNLIAQARDQRTTISTIAIGDDADTELLTLLAQWGGGRYYFAATPEDIPRLTLLESEIARSDPTVEEPLRAQLAAPHPLIRDFAPAELPQLDGYVATSSKTEAEIVLRSPEDDPLMASWQYGLGRAVAWTSSAGAPWSAEWLAWPDYDRFWAQVVRYTLPEPDSGPLQVRVEPRPGGARLVVEGRQAGGEPLNLASVAARITLPDGDVRDIAVRQVEPGRYAQDLRLPSEGAYAVSVVAARDGERVEAQTGYVQEAPEEYRAVTDEQLTGAALLESIADLTGGRLLGAADGDAAGAATPLANTPPRPLWPWLLGAALLLWILEIAVRRGAFVRG